MKLKGKPQRGEMLVAQNDISRFKGATAHAQTGHFSPKAVIPNRGSRKGDRPKSP
jgi:hypothetical protein